nr:ARID DNA-binding domain-containing protein [Tanacetum cinerariifolium]
MVNTNSFLEAKWRERTKHKGHDQLWYQSKNHGRPPRKTSRIEFLQRQIKKDKEDMLGRCVRQITKDWVLLKGRIMGTDNGTWDDFWRGFDHEWKQGLLDSRGAHYAPEVTLNILSINQLKQLRNLDVDKIRQRHNDYLDDYCESLDKERTDKEGEEPRIVENTDTSELHTFQEYVAFLNLIKDDDETSKEWDTYRNRFDKVLKWFYNHYLKRPLPGTIPPIIQGVPIHLFDLYKLINCMGGYLSVQFGQEFGGASFAVEKGKERLEHFGIKLEEEEDCKQQQPAYQKKEETQIKCYKCQDLGHYVFKCPNKNEKYQNRFTSYKRAPTSKPTNNKDTQSTSSDDFTVIT